MGGERYLATKARPQWLLDFKRDASTAAHWGHSFRESWTQYRSLHIRLRSHGRRAVEIVPEQTVYPEDVAGVIAVASAPSVARKEEWDAVEAVMQTIETRMAQIPFLLDALCSECVARVGDLGIVTVEGDAEETRALEEIRHLIARFSTQGPSQRRRFLHMLHVINEAGTTTTVALSESGELSCAQGGLDTRVVLKETG